LRKEIRTKIGKQPGDFVKITIIEKMWISNSIN
jgi:hypothetical protein